jgi:hypothetical protein
MEICDLDEVVKYLGFHLKQIGTILRTIFGNIIRRKIEYLYGAIDGYHKEED